VILCARSAHTRPRDTTRSHVLSWLILARRDASRSRATFCAGVSFGGGAAPRSIVVAVVLECACGPVAVKRVASWGVRGIVWDMQAAQKGLRMRLAVAVAVLHN
jgi:hypothetical protein